MPVAIQRFNIPSGYAKKGNKKTPLQVLSFLAAGQ
jgi:hypothetical protein